MWPMLLDMSRDECRRILRRFELEAYAAIITAFRAQGVLTVEKKSLLKEIASELNISMERHRAEVRRAVNDEKLATIAEHMAGPDTGTEWAIVGRRLVPLMPRLVPQTAFTVLANNVANLTAAGNARLPVPSATAKLPGSDPMLPESSVLEPVGSPEGSAVPNCTPCQPLHTLESGNLTVKVPSSCQSPVNETSVAPSMNFKRELDDDGEEVDAESFVKRIRTASADEFESSPDFDSSPAQTGLFSTISDVLSPSKLAVSVAAASTTSSPPAPLASHGACGGATRLLTAPVKITLTSTTTWPTSTSSSSSSGGTQKVIIVSSSGSCGSPSILQRSLSVPMVKTVSSAQSMLSTSLSSVNSASSLSSRGPTSYVINSNGGPVSSSSGTVVTISTGSSNDSCVSKSNSDGSVTATTVSIDGVPTAAYISSVPAVAGNSVSIHSGLSSGFGSVTSSMVHKMRPKPQNVNVGGISRPRTGPIVIPVTPNAHHPLHQSLTCSGTTGISSMQQKSLLGVHSVKQDGSTLGKAPGGMKILPISGVANAGVAKILPKPTKGSSLYVVNANSSNANTSASQMSVVSRVVPTSVLAPSPNPSSLSVLGARNLACGGRINLTGSARSNNTPTSVPMSTLGTTSGAISAGTAVIMHQSASSSSYSAPVTGQSGHSSVASGKSNVIVVQKGPAGNATFSRSVTLGATTKEFVGKVVKGKTVNPSSVASITVQRRPVPSNNISSTSILTNSTTNAKSGSAINLPTSNSQGNVIVLDLSNEQGGGSSILNELLHGSGIYADSLSVPSPTTGGEESAMDSVGEVPSSLEEENKQDAPILSVPQTRVVSLEEAVELFGASLGEDGHILLGKSAAIDEEMQPEPFSAKPSDSRGKEGLPPIEAEVVVNFNADY